MVDHKGLRNLSATSQQNHTSVCKIPLSSDALNEDENDFTVF